MQPDTSYYVLAYRDADYQSSENVNGYISAATHNPSDITVVEISTTNTGSKDIQDTVTVEQVAATSRTLTVKGLGGSGTGDYKFAYANVNFFTSAFSKAEDYPDSYAGHGWISEKTGISSDNEAKFTNLFPNTWYYVWAYRDVDETHVKSDQSKAFWFKTPCDNMLKGQNEGAEITDADDVLGIPQRTPVLQTIEKTATTMTVSADNNDKRDNGSIRGESGQRVYMFGISKTNDVHTVEQWAVQMNPENKKGHFDEGTYTFNELTPGETYYIFAFRQADYTNRTTYAQKYNPSEIVSISETMKDE